MGPRRSRKVQKASKAAVNEESIENNEDVPAIEEAQTESNAVANEEKLDGNEDVSVTENVQSESNAVANEEKLDANKDVSTMENVQSESNAVANEEKLNGNEDVSATENVQSESNAVANEEKLDSNEDVSAMENVQNESNAVGNEKILDNNENVSTMEEVPVEPSTAVDEESVIENEVDDNVGTTCVDQSGESSAPPPVLSPHPYAEAIEKCPCHDWQLEEKDPEPLTTLEETQLTMVTSKEELDEMMTKLKFVKEIAVASKRDKFMSFKGRNCLIQISTPSEDFLIDVIALKESVEVLNGIFSDLNILKVMYKADNFLSCLKNDFTVYLVNLFDLYIASRDLSEEDRKRQDSLSLILKQLCSINLPYKKTGWRKWDVRPLPSDHVSYARQETHYMLHAKDKLQNSLIKKNILKQFYTNCNRICSVLSPAEQDLHTRFKPEDYESILGAETKDMNKSQIEVIRLLFAWRYESAKTHDKGPAYVLPNKSLLNIARCMPKESREIQACIKNHQMSPILERNLEVIQKLISKAITDFPSTNGPGVGSALKAAKRKYANAGSGTSANIDEKRRKKQGTDFGSRNNFGAGRFGARTRPFMNSGMRPMMGPNSMMGPNPMMGPRMGPLMQPRMGGMRMGPMMGPRMGPRMAQAPWDREKGSMMGQGMGQGMGPRMGQPPWELGSGKGPRMGSGVRPGMAPRVDQRMGPRMNAGRSSGLGHMMGPRGVVRGPGMGRTGAPQQRGQQMDANRERFHDALASAIAKVIVKTM